MIGRDVAPVLVGRDQLRLVDPAGRHSERLNLRLADLARAGGGIDRVLRHEPEQPGQRDPVAGVLVVGGLGVLLTHLAAAAAVRHLGHVALGGGGRRHALLVCVVLVMRHRS